MPESYLEKLKPFPIEDVMAGRTDKIELNVPYYFHESQIPAHTYIPPFMASKKKGLWLADNKSTTFDNCFENPFIYELELVYRRALCDFLQKNLKSGEFAEIYTLWTDHVNEHFGSPTKEETVALEDYLEMSKSSGSPGFEDRHKLTIYKTN